MDLKTASEWVSAAFEATGVLVIAGGFLVALAGALRDWRSGRGKAYVTMRDIFGRGVLLGLEILVAADLIRTVAVAPTLDNLLTLGLLVLIRTFLSWSFEIELEGVVPWKRYQIEHETGDAT
jgi:uncharacterized membrane protein